jgi:hypothetical protein
MFRLTYLFAPAIVTMACSASPAEHTAAVGSLLTGPVDMRMAEDVDDDATALAASPATQPTHVVVTIQRVDARVDGRGDDDVWTTLSLARKTVDLLALPSGGFLSLGITQLPAGGVERLRLFVDPSGPNYVITADGRSHALVVPSDAIKVNGDFDAEGCAAGQVTLAFAGRRSIEVHPLSDGVPTPATPATDAGPDASTPPEWVLRPVLRVKEVVMQDAGCTTDEDHDRGHADDDGFRDRR